VVRAYDPAAGEAAAALMPELDVRPDAYEASAGADVVALLTEWEEFRWLDFERVRAAMARPAIVDARNLLDPAAMRRRGFEYSGIGRR
jgi:UDPglucose 6-dehydrogenase